MSTASKYWTLVKLEGSGRLKRCEISSAKAFFQQAFPNCLNQTQVQDVQIQKQLLQWMRESSSPTPLARQEAECCLLCFISWEIEHVCIHLAQKFGAEHGFSCNDLFPFVLDEEGVNDKQPLGQKTTYRSLARDILQSFDAQQSGLATWTNRRVKFHPEINTFLLQHGVYLISDWAILNDTRPQQLEHILLEFYQLTPLETEQQSRLLSCYHNVYRAQRLQQRKTGVRKLCQPPTSQQYQQMAQQLALNYQLELSPKTVAVKLQDVATKIRQYRTCIRGGYLPTESLHPADGNDSWVDRIAAPEPTEDEDEYLKQQEFLKWYQQQLSISLQGSIAQVLETWLKGLQKRGSQQSEQFLIGLHLFHCQGKSMGEIASALGLKAQYQVTRLLKLKAFRSDVQHHLLKELCDRISDYTKSFPSAQNLDTWQQNIEKALDEEIEPIFQQAESDSYVSQNRPLDSPFFKALCHYLDLRKKNPELIHCMISILSKSRPRST